MIFPEWNALTIVLYSGLALMALSSAPMEYWGPLQMQYSKFRAASGMPSRPGMVILYAVPLVVLTVLASPYLAAPTEVQAVVFGAVFLHFAKRVLESLFLHRYSGPMTITTVIMVTSLYSLLTGVIGYLNRQPMPAMDGIAWVGVLLFIAGEIGNFLHHRRLAQMRQSTMKYVIPRGLLFDYAICPHYFCELVAWFGILLMARHFALLLLFLFMVGYLTTRAVKTLRWYRQEFPNFPADVKVLVPFVF
jgi:3-oxo-5-alpha-steroid 4-dehydrogenase